MQGKDKRVGGEGLYIINYLQYSVRENFIGTHCFRSLFIAVMQQNHRNLILEPLYRPLDHNICDFKDEFLINHNLFLFL